MFEKEVIEEMKQDQWNEDFVAEQHEKKLTTDVEYAIQHTSLATCAAILEGVRKQLLDNGHDLSYGQLLDRMKEMM